MTLLVLAVAVLHRPPLVEVALTLGAVHQPIATGTAMLVLVAASGMREARHSRVDPAVGLIVAAAGDLRAGRPLRSVVASGLFGEELASVARSGRPIRASGEHLEDVFGHDTLLVRATLDLATESGGPVADTFDRLAADLIEAERTRRERRAALAPAVAQAIIVGGAPLAVLAHMVISGRWMAIVSMGPIAASVLVAGTVALVAGAIWIAALVGRGRSR